MLLKILQEHSNNRGVRISFSRGIGRDIKKIEEKKIEEEMMADFNSQKIVTSNMKNRNPFSVKFTGRIPTAEILEYHWKISRADMQYITGYFPQQRCSNITGGFLQQRY